MFAALPAPTPEVLVGVFTETKMISASAMAASIFVEKNKFLKKMRRRKKEKEIIWESRLLRQTSC